MTPRSLFAVLVLLAVSGASADEPPPWQLPSFDGQSAGREKPPIGGLNSPPRPDAQGLFDLVLTCYPTRSWWQPEVSFEARAAQRPSSASNTVASEAATYAGVVARIPLYSAVEVDRERVRELQRRETVAQAVSEFDLSLRQRAIHRRELAMFRALERRSIKRVAAGIADTTEQVSAMKDVAARENDIATDEAKIIKSRLSLVGMCKDRRDLVEYLNRWASWEK